MSSDASSDWGDREGDTRAIHSTARRVTETAFGVLFFTAVLLAAFPMGANRDWAWSPIVVLLGALAVLHSLGLGIAGGHVLRAAEWRALSLVTLSFLIVIAIGVIQVSPLAPPSWQSSLYERAGAALGHPIAGIISLDSDATRAILMKIVACGAIFVMARATCRNRQRARLFLVLFVISAAMVTAYGLVMQATNGSCYVFSYNKRPEFTPFGRQYLCALSGTFVNSNSYAAFTGMALVVALGLIFSPGDSGPEDEEGTASAGASTWFAGARAVYLAIAMLLVGGLLLAGSRAGFAATVLGVVLLGVTLSRRRWPSRPAMGLALVATICIGAVLMLIAGSAFFHKMESFSDQDLLGRFRIWHAAITAIKQSPWFGWGLGTYPDVYVLLQPPDVLVPNDKAHSTPLEWALELGIPGALCAFATVLISLSVCLRGCWRRRTDRYLPAIAFAASMVAVLHSMVDFSLQIPAIGFLVSALLGMGWAQSFRRYE